MQYYNDKDTIYFSTVRTELINLANIQDHQTILEIGAAGGDTLIAIKKSHPSIKATGIELFELPNSNQRNPIIDEFIVGSIEELENPVFLNHFDVIIIGDVLEHLLDPWKTIDKLTHWLKLGGKLIVSTPNVRDVETLYKIVVKGDFQYGRSGVLDKTHLRFFCKKNIVDLVTSPSLALERITTNFKEIMLPSKRRVVNTITLGLFEEFLATQYFTVSRKV
jgi:2-polyprenyl-3-methyl-5-hydroxy-6-metoxy-1,4-benzoquinol methylase